MNGADPLAPAPRSSGLAARALGPLLAALLTALLSASPARDATMRAWIDVSLRWAAPPAAGAAAAARASTLVVDIDRASLRTLQPTHGDWPWSRERHAELAERLLAAGARAVVFNLELADRRDGDAALAAVVARSGRVVLGVGAGPPGGVADPLPAGSGWRAAQGFEAPVLALRAPAASVLPDIGTGAGGGADGGPRLGMISTPLDPDGRLRCLPLLLRGGVGGPLLPALPLAAIAAAESAPPIVRRLEQPAPGAVFGSHRWPLAAGDCVLLRLPVSADAVPSIAAAAVALAAPLDPAVSARVRGRTVFVGSASAMDAPVATPFGQVGGTQWQALAHAALVAGWTMAPSAAPVTALLLALAALPVLWNASRRAPRTRDDIVAMGLAAAAIVAVVVWRQQLAHELTRFPLAALLWVCGAAGIALRRWRLLAAEREASQVARAAAEAASRAKTEFLAHVSHEIRTPLNAVLGMVQLLRATPLDATQRRYVEVFESAGDHLRQLIDDLLDLARVEAGRLAVEHEPFALVALLDELAALFASRARAQGLDFALEVHPTLPRFVRGDRHRLRQALSNLLGNAIKFTPHGRVVLRARPADAGAAGDAAMLEFEVVDSGIGIAAERLDAIFEPFTQADARTARDYGGSGLGLAITRRLARAMGGEVTLDSRPDAGTTARLRVAMPACAPPVPAAGVDPVAPARDPAAAPPGAWGGRRLLLAEDHPHNVLVVEGLLAGTGVELAVAGDGEQAVRMAASGNFDALLMDVHMPRLDGHAAVRAIRAQERAAGRARVPIVALSANALPSDRAASLAAGCDVHLAKPVERGALLAALQRLLPLRPTPGAENEPPAPAAATAPAHPSGASSPAAAAVLDRAGALDRLGGDTRLYDRLLDAARPSIDDWAASFVAARRAADAVLAQRLAHDLKGLAGTIGAPALAHAAAELQQRLRSGAPAADVDGARQAVERAVAALQAQWPRPGARAVD